MSEVRANDEENLAEYVNSVLDEPQSSAGDNNTISEDETMELASDVSAEDLFGYDSDADPEYLPSDYEDNGEDTDSEDEQINEQGTPNQANVNTPDFLNLTWGSVNRDKLVSFQYNPHPLFSDEVLEKIQNASPFEIYQMFADDGLFDEIVQQTNLYAEQCIGTDEPSDHSRLKSWIPTNQTEIKRFFGIIMWMGLVPLASIDRYWSTNKLYKNDISKVMPRNRFEILLRMLHFGDNETADKSNKLYKVQGILDKLQAKFKSIIHPQEDICIDETLIPFRGRVGFRQYIPNKTHRYGIKMFKLCVEKGYTWAFEIYQGKVEKQNAVGGVAQCVVMKLAESLLDNGRTLYVDNWYTSVTLAHALHSRSTHLVGTLRKGRKGNPLVVQNARLKRNEIVAKQSNTNVVVLKWKDKRDVMMLSTKHVDTTVDIPQKRQQPPKSKPICIMDYNKAKSYIDVSDQLASYSSPLRRNVKWYKKLVFEVLLNTAVVNSLVVFNKVQRKMKITNFREEIALKLLETPDDDAMTAGARTPKHMLIEVEGPKSSCRRRCNMCYKTLAKAQGRIQAQKLVKKVITKCDKCNIFLCLSCFNKGHNKG